MGHSHGGLFTSYALTERPALFGWHLALDAPVHHADGWMAKRLIAAVAEDPGLAKRYVSVQESYRWPEEQWTAFATAASPRFSVSRIADLDETHESLGFLGTAHGLKRLFSDYAEARDLPANTEALTEHYAALSEQYGYAEAGARYEVGWSVYDDADHSVTPLAAPTTLSEPSAGCWCPIAAPTIAVES